MTGLKLFNDVRRKRIVQYHIYNNQYNLSRNQMNHAEQMHLVTVI